VLAEISFVPLRRKDGSTMKKLLALLAVGLMVFGTIGCSSTTPTKKDKGTGGDAVILEITEIDVFPGKEAKPVKITKGKAESAEAPEGSGLTAEVKDGAVVVKADKKAKEGKTHEVTVKSKDGKTAKLKVKVKKEED
jgi:hypothetical protein